MADTPGKKEPARFIVEFEGSPLSDDDVKMILNDIIKTSLASVNNIKAVTEFDQWGSFGQWQSFAQHA
jgi:hypothetical protein